VAYRKSAISMAAMGAPDAARARIIEAFKAAGGDATIAAAKLDVARRTFDRLVQSLGLAPEIAKLRAKLRKVRRAA
jgi:transcriptional regulator of acetoin/glycerol metabolism